MTRREVIRRLRRSPVSRQTADAAIALIKKLQAALARSEAQGAARQITPEGQVQEAHDELADAEDAIIEADRQQPK